MFAIISRIMNSNNRPFINNVSILMHIFPDLVKYSCFISETYLDL